MMKYEEMTGLRDGRGGFTLIEVMIAILILSVGVLATALLQISAIRGGAFANQVTQASIDGQDKIEELRNTDYTSLAGGKDTVVSGNGISYTREWKVEKGKPYTDSAEIDLTVSWTGPQGNPHSVQFSTIVFR